jgi:hypothetical protein
MKARKVIGWSALAMAVLVAVLVQLALTVVKGLGGV